MIISLIILFLSHLTFFFIISTSFDLTQSLFRGHSKAKALLTFPHSHNYSFDLLTKKQKWIEMRSVPRSLESRRNNEKININPRQIYRNLVQCMVHHSPMSSSYEFPNQIGKYNWLNCTFDVPVLFQFRFWSPII